MPASNTYVRTASVALPSADGCRASVAVIFGGTLLVIGAYCFCPSVCEDIGLQNSGGSDQVVDRDNGLEGPRSNPPERVPVRIIESHCQNGNRTLDKRLGLTPACCPNSVSARGRSLD